MVQIGTPEQYFGSTKQVVIAEPIVPQPLEAKVVEPVQITPALQTTDYTPLVLGIVAICFFGFLAFLAWSWKK